MLKSATQRLGVFLALALVMALTRVHHFETLPDASWAIFFLAGFWLRGAWRWAFPLLLAEAVLVDYLVITRLGIPFWSHYCVSPAYGCLVAAYGALWLGGSWLAARRAGTGWSMLGLGVAALLVSEGVCFLISNGSFYWISASVPAPRSMAAWLANMGDWYLPFLKATALYAGLGAALHVLARQLSQVLALGGQPQR